MDTMMRGDNTDLSLGPTRRISQPPPKTNAYSTGTTSLPITQNPEARAVSTARMMDSERRQANTRKMEGFQQAPAEPPKDKQFAGFAMNVPVDETDAPPPDWRITQSQALRQSAQQRAARMQSLQSQMDSVSAGSDQYNQLERLLMTEQGLAAQESVRADALMQDYSNQQYASQQAQAERENALAAARLQKPPDSIYTDAQSFAQTARAMGIAGAASAATDAQFIAANQIADPSQPIYQQRYANNALQAAAVVFADRVNSRQVPSISDPAILELSSILAQSSTGDPKADRAARQQKIAQVVGQVQQMARMRPEQAMQLGSLLVRAVEYNIIRMQKMSE